MKASEITVGRVYAVWLSRKLRPVLIQGRNPSGSYYGRVYPGGRVVRVKGPEAVSEQLMSQTGPGRMTGVDFKSRAAGERED